MSRTHSDINAVLLQMPQSTRVSVLYPADLKFAESQFNEINTRESEIRTSISMMEKYIRRFNFCLWIARLIEFGGLAYATKILVEQYGPYSQASEDSVNALHRADYDKAVQERPVNISQISNDFLDAGCSERKIEDFWWNAQTQQQVYFTHEYGSYQAGEIAEDKHCPLEKDGYGRSLDELPPEICRQLIHRFCALARPVLESTSYVSQRVGYVFALLATTGAMMFEVTNIICRDLLALATWRWPANFSIPLDCVDWSFVFTVAENYGIAVDKNDMRKTLQNFREAQDPRHVLACVKHSPASPLHALLKGIGLFKQISQLAGFTEPLEKQTETAATAGPPRDRASMHRVIM
jgi:hypothetical protein